MGKENQKNPACVILWQDAAYSYEKEFPKEFPLPQLTAGFIISANDEDDFINIAMNVEYDEKTGKLYPLDGFLIPKKSKIEFRNMGFFNE
ncbi:hypothetical protein HZC33_01135 [Candidatus Wolfebacteria bacterium]|nr:hypothetical protein [Candidatus Wolfebacteria bacterium]